MKTENVSQTQGQPATPKPSSKRRLWYVALGLVLTIGAGAYAGFNYVLPTKPGVAQTLGARIEWYRTHGQMRADLQSLRAWGSYLWQPERIGVTTVAEPELSVAEMARPRVAQPAGLENQGAEQGEIM